jgi:hypothetical protein
MDAACTPWFEEGFREQFGIGAFRLTPGGGVDEKLGEVVLGMLGSRL